jgi:hypothetical protein
MNDHMLKFSSAEVSQLRALVVTVGVEMAKDPRTATAAGSQPEKSALEVAWSRVVAMLDLGAEPETRVCPQCKSLCFAGASRCGHCWTSLPTAKVKNALAA